MRDEYQIHRFILTILSIWITIFLIVLITLHVQDATANLSAAIILLFSVVISSGFVGMSFFEILAAFDFGPGHKREVFAYLILACIDLMSGVALASVKSISLATIAVVISPHPLLFGIVLLRIARHMERHGVQRSALIFLGLFDISAALILGCSYWIPSDSFILRVLGLSALTALLQFVPFLIGPDPIQHGNKSRISSDR